MNSIFLDCDLMRFPNSGLYHYCLNLGEEVNKLLANDKDMSITAYVPANEKSTFNTRVIVEKKWHKFWKPFLKRNSIWHTPFQSGRMIISANKHPNIKKVLTIHDLNTIHEGKPAEEQQKNLQHTQTLIDENDAIICISEFTKNDVLRHCNIRNKPLYVIHNGCNPLLLPTRKPTSINIEKAFFFGLGYVNAKKNYKVLIPLLKYYPDVALVISGKLDDLEYVKKMRAYAQELGVAERLHITGPITEEEKGWYMSNCLAFFQPSLAEGFGFPVIEAMSVGKPVFISDRTSLPEVGGDAAFYLSSFEPDAIRCIFEEGMEAFRNGNIREHVIKQSKRFNWETSATQYLQVYKSLITQRFSV